MGASQAAAALAGRGFVTPDDVQAVCAPILRHRIILTPERELEGKTPADLIKRIVQSVEVPR